MLRFPLPPYAESLTDQTKTSFCKPSSLAVRYLFFCLPLFLPHSIPGQTKTQTQTQTQIPTNSSEAILKLRIANKKIPSHLAAAGQFNQQNQPARPGSEVK
ncbi:hypothetical protein VTJ04DRAFT_8880 [Mycothermus thermophilus]|uniref:uncharacterized protein n=1 Tax=Humicola insolens TaxID=85995 RepID=UPI0037447D01